MYKLKDKYKDKEAIVFKRNGRWINLTGKEIKKIIAATEKNPRVEIVSQSPTQEDLKYLFDLKSPYVEEVEKIVNTPTPKVEEGKK